MSLYRMFSKTKHQAKSQQGLNFLSIVRKTIDAIIGVSLLFLCPIFSFAQSSYVGSQTCAGCHQQQNENWQKSHHWHAMEEASLDSVLGDFSNVEFDYFGTTSTFFQTDNKYFVRTDNSAGELEEFEIKYTFGFYPLQQYLIEFHDGRLQTLSITWDSRSREEGGQRWYHLYPDEEVASNNPLHWTGSFQNWNSRCASCHSTNVEKNYSLQNNTYDTTYSEINVSCESCHGPGSEHLLWAGGDTSLTNRGLVNSLQKAWTPAGTGEGQLQAILNSIEQSNPTHYSAQKEVCASCHSRRAELAHRDLSNTFLDNYSLSVLREGLYYPDGQIQDEVYVYGSFLQSKMHQNQVSCTNCHEPHTQQLLIQGNGLCLQCHNPAQFENEQHFFHEQGSAGAQCINCHMPATTYMGVDDRRDHSFRIPDPIASLEIGVPNACTQCHTDKDDNWAAENFTALTGKTESHYPHGLILDRARANIGLVLPQLLALADDEMAPAIIRASAIVEAGHFPSQEALTGITTALKSPDPLIRASGASSLEFLPVPNRYQLLQPLITDPVKSVRIEVARQLAGLPIEQLPAVYAGELNTVFEEFITTAIFNADLPGIMTDLGVFYLNNNDNQNAEQALLQALSVSPGYLPALLNLADLYRILQREDEGEILLNRAISLFPGSANAHHALGLLFIRTQRVNDSISSFERASVLDPDNARFVLVYSVALESIGEIDQAISLLESAVQRFPTNSQLYEILRDYSSRRVQQLL